MRHMFQPTLFHITLGPHEPVLHIRDGDTVSAWCVDAGGYDRHGKQITDGGDPQTGPFFVEGAEPGDAIAVRFDRLWPNRARGFTAPRVALGVVDPAFAAALPDAEVTGDDWFLDLERGVASLESPPPGLEGLELPFEPFLGCFGVAPSREQAISTATSGRTAGTWTTAASARA